MLLELNMVGNWYKNESKSSWKFDEFKFDDEAKSAFESLDLDIDMFDHSARVDVEKNHCYIPSHYFLYALKLQPLVLLVGCYMDIFDQIITSKLTAVDFEKLVQSKSPSNSITDALDNYSRDNFFDVFRDSTYRLGAKSIVNVDAKKGKKYRGQSDFARSIILKALPVPDASSGMLGHLIYAFSKNQHSYQVLIDKYCSHVPNIFNSKSSDDLLLMIVSTLGLQGKLEPLLVNPNNRKIDWDDISNAFLISSTPVSGNTQYVDKPVHYSTSLKEYVHIKKGLLSTQELQDKVSKLISKLWPNVVINQDGSDFSLQSVSRVKASGPPFEGAENKIFYGAPGTGKSHKVQTEASKGAEKVITVFHPDTQYSDFVGSLKPMMEKNTHGVNSVTYQFRPGPFTNALVKALVNPDIHICLIIEEINRAPAAAVFGELFQLLDRNQNGESTYKIDAADPDMLKFINEQLLLAYFPELIELHIPANLSLLATMNSSDQAVMALDTAFKRRWSFEYLDIDFSHAEVPKTDISIATANGIYVIKWPELAKIINYELVDKGVAEDRLVGPFFLNNRELATPAIAKSSLNGKLFVYLWDDVLRHLGHEKLFSGKYKTFGLLSRAFNKDEAIFNSVIETAIEAKGVKVDVDEALEDAEQ